MIVGNNDSPSTLGYYATDSGSDIENLAPVTLMVSFELRIPQAYKPGVGRPDFRAVTYGTVSEWQAFKNVAATIESGEPNKGMIYRARAAMAPGSRITLELVGVDFKRDMLQNFVEFNCTDDWGGASNVVAVSRVRPRDEVPDELEQDADLLDSGISGFIANDSTSHSGAAWFSWQGRFNSLDPNGFTRVILPTGIEPVMTNGGFYGLRNATNDNIIVIVTGAYYGVSSQNMYVDGDRDGAVLDVGNNTCRLSLHFKVLVGGAIAYGPTLAADNAITYTSVTVVRAQPADLYVNI